MAVPSTASERRGIPRRFTLAALLLSLFVLVLAWQSPRPLLINVAGLDDQYISGFQPREEANGRTYRWTKAQARILVPGAGYGEWRATLTLASGRPPTDPPVEFTVTLNGQPFRSFTASADYSDISFDIPASSTRLGDIDIRIDTPTFHPPNDDRELGLVFARLLLTPELPLAPPPVGLGALALALVALFLALRLAITDRLALALTGAAALLMALLIAIDRLALMPYTSQMLMLGVGLYCGLYILRACWRSFAANGPYGPLLALLPALALGYALFSFVGVISNVAFTRVADDFNAVCQAALEMAATGTPYQLDKLLADPFGPYYKYPPLLALLIQPIASLPGNDALEVWDFLNLLALGLALAVLLKVHGRSIAAVRPATLALIFIALVYQPVADTLLYGQVDIVLLLLVTLCYAALRSDKPLLAGPPLALAILLKLYPGLLVLYLLWRREWRALASLAVSLLALFGGVALFTGLEPWWVFLTQVLPASGNSAWIENQSFGGFVGRLFMDRLKLEPFPADNPWAAFVSAATYAWSALVLLVSFLVVRRPADRHGDAYALGFAIWTAASVLILPVAWYHYATLFLLPLGITLFTLEERSAAWLAATPRPTVVIVTLFIFAAAVLSYGSYGLVWHGVNNGGLWKLILSYKFYAMLGAWIALLLMLRRAQEEG